MMNICDFHGCFYEKLEKFGLNHVELEFNVG